MGTPADPIGWMAIAASAAQGATSIIGGLNESAQMRSQAMEAEYEAELAELRGVQASADRAEELNKALGAINSMRSSRGLTMDSATGREIRRDRREKSRYAENIDVLNERFTAVAQRNRASGLRAGAKWAKIRGFAKALPDFAQAGSDFQSLGS